MGINELIQVGNQIRKYRTEKGLSQKAMAELVGIPYSTYSNYENNNREPSIEQLKKIADTLGVTMVELCAGNLGKYKDNLINYYSSDESLSAHIAPNKQEAQRGLNNAKYAIDALNSLPTEDIAVFLPAFGKLNKEGQGKAIEHIEMLAKIPEYQKEHEPSTED